MNIKKKPDIAGYYWAKRYNAWVMVQVMVKNNLVFRTFNGEEHFCTIVDEWIGPLIPDGVEIYVTVPA